MITVIIPTLSKGIQKDHLPKLEKLLSYYLPRQTYDDYEALVFCDGGNIKVEKMIEGIKDVRIKYFYTTKTLGLWGHPQTRTGIKKAKGKYIVRMNDDNIPYLNYLDILMKGFKRDIGVTYARVKFMGEAKEVHGYSFKGYNNFVLPKDKKGKIEENNIDCMNYMVKAEIAKKYVNAWDDSFGADWRFIKVVHDAGHRFEFINKLVGEKH